MKTVIVNLEVLAARRGALVLTCDLVAHGLTDDQVRWVTRPLHRIRSGAYSLVEPATARDRHILHSRAVVHRHHQLVAASHVSAAVLHGLPLWGVSLELAHVTGVGHVRRGIRHGVHTHRGPLDPPDLVRLDGIDVTSTARTVLDCARCLPLEQAVAIADHALHHGMTTRAELSSRHDAMPSVTGVDQVRRVLALADGRAESVGESRSRVIVVEGGIEVIPQAVIRNAAGEFVARGDLLVRGSRVLIEFDGKAKYLLNGDVEQAHWKEKLRHDAINDAGFIVVRLTWRELERPAAVVAKVRAAMARALKLSA